jgi:DNA-binding XRE family transcriptional regulator
MLKTRFKTLRETRIALKLTQEEVANAIGVSQKTLSNIEKHLTSPTLEDCVNLCKLYGIKVKDLFEMLFIDTTDLF